MRSKKTSPKITKKSLTRRLDAEWARVIKLRERCIRCSRGAESVQLQAAHIFSRNRRSVRWDTENGVCFCAGCHFWAHHNPVLFAETVREYLGELRYITLKNRATSLKKWSLEEMQELLETLKAV